MIPDRAHIAIHVHLMNSIELFKFISHILLAQIFFHSKNL